MTKRNMELLDEVIKNRLEQVQHPNAESEEDKQAFREAMEALNKRIELEKIEAARQEQISNEVVKVEESKKDRWLQIILFAGTAILVPVVQHISTSSHMKKLCNFEKDYTFTTSAGRSLASGLFRFKK